MSNVNWSVSGTGSTGTQRGNDYVVTVGSAAFTVTCTATLSATPQGSETPVTVDGASQTTDQIAVLSNQEAFEAAAKTVTYQDRTYNVTGTSGNYSVSIEKFANDPDFSASNLNVAVTGYNDAAKSVLIRPIF